MYRDHQISTCLLLVSACRSVLGAYSILLVGFSDQAGQAKAIPYIKMSGFGAEFLLTMLKKFVIVGMTCVFALGGAVVGTITGALTGQTTETGFIRGAGIGAIAGAVVAIELFESLLNDESSSSKIGMVGSLLNGKIFREWVCPAMLKAYQWQIGTLETNYREISDIFDTHGTRGMPTNIVVNLPNFNITCNQTKDENGEKISCSICLQNFKVGECARELPSCKHLFHQLCIDGWLLRQGTCPVCREDV